MDQMIRNHKITFAGAAAVMLGLIMMAAENAASYVAEDGILVEHFWMVPIGELTALIGVIMIVIAKIAKS